MAELDSGLTAEAQWELERWLSKSPAHKTALLQVAILLDRVSVLSGLSRLFPLEQFPLHSPLRKPKRRLSLRVGLVAGVLLASSVASLLWLGLQGWNLVLTEALAVQDIYSTEIGEQLSVRLPDGSELILNTDTRMEVHYSPEERKILLDRGEGYFVVANDPARPFRVHAGRRIVEAIGTAFTVQRVMSGSLEVLVTEGSVSLRHTVGQPAPEVLDLQAVHVPAVPEAPLSLVAGESATFREAEDLIETTQMRPEEIEARLAWRHGMLLFQGDPLELVLQEVSRYTTIVLEADADVRSVPVFGYFRVGDIDRLLAAMRDNFRISAQRLGEDHILLVRQ